MIYSATVVLSGLFIVLLYNPVRALFTRVRRNWEQHQELERAEARRRLAVARIQLISGAAEQAMWDESLTTYMGLRR